MTRKSKRELARELEDLDGGGDSVPVAFADFYVYYYYCTGIHGSLPGGPDPVEFFGGEPEPSSTDYWKRMIRVWDGEDDPPIPDEELHTRIETHRQELGEEYPDADKDQ